MERIPIGQLRHRISVQSETMATDASGGALPTYSTIDTRWAKIDPLEGRELYNAQQTVAGTTHKIAMRFYSGLTPKHRLLYGTRIFRIISVLNPEEFGIYSVCMCVEKVA